MELKTSKGRLFFFLLIIIFLPLLENTFSFIESGKLQGAIIPQPNIQFTPEKWWNGNYQKGKTLFINDSIGFRPDLVRMNNQIDFWLFKKLTADDICLGNNDNLFSKGYIDEYEGRTYIGDSIIRHELIKVKLIQDTLERMGKTFIFTYAPSKPYYMPENIPWLLRRLGGPKVSNYKTFRRLSDSLKIKQLDFNALFMAMKDTSKNPLFSKLGVHWSIYGSVLASDTMIKFIDRERNIKMPELVITKLFYPDTMRSPDNDLANCSNLIYPITKERLCYPEYHYNIDRTTTKPKVIFIGDSFLWLWIGDGFIQNCTNDWKFWYYFNEMWDIKGVSGQGIHTINDTNWIKPMLKTDCIVTVYAPINFGALMGKTAFIDRMYNYFYPGRK